MTKCVVAVIQILYRSSPDCWITLSIEQVPTAPESAPMRPENSDIGDRFQVLVQ